MIRIGFSVGILLRVSVYTDVFAIYPAEAGNDPADKTGTGANRQHTANQTRRKARAIRDGESDITRQYRHQSAKRRTAANLHQRRRQRVRHLKGFNTKGEGSAHTVPRQPP